MSINNHWRNKQVGNSLLTQELICLNFLSKHQDLQWAWYGMQGNFFEQVQQDFDIVDQDPTGLILINAFTRKTPGEFVAECRQLMTDSVQAVYLAVNRYEFVAINDLYIDYSDSMGQAINQIVEHIQPQFVKIPVDQTKIDGRHFVGVHGLDIFTYERGQ